MWKNMSICLCAALLASHLGVFGVLDWRIVLFLDAGIAFVFLAAPVPPDKITPALLDQIFRVGSIEREVWDDQKGQLVRQRVYRQVLVVEPNGAEEA